MANLLQFGPDETIQTVLSIPNYDVAKYLVLATRSGKVKKTALAEYDSPRQGGLIAVRLMTDENGENADELIGAALCNADDDIILVSKQGMSLKFEANDEQLRPMGRQTAGVQGMKFRDGDELLAMDVVQGDSDRDLLVVTNEGFAKRTAISEYRLQGRNATASRLCSSPKAVAPWWVRDRGGIRPDHGHHEVRQGHPLQRRRSQAHRTYHPGCDARQA